MSRKQKKLLFRIVLAAALMVSALLCPISTAKIILSLACYIVVGYDVIFTASRNILYGQVFDERFLMTVATLGALALSEFTEASAVMLFYQTGELLQSLAVSKSRRSIALLMDIRPDRAVVVRGGSEIDVSPDEVEVGETIIVRPGERIPLDGEIISGFTSVNTAALTGESLPSDKSLGDSVMSGTVNLSGVIQVKTASRAEDSCVSRILELVENAADKKAKTENFITRFAKYYTPCVVAAALILAIIPPIFLGGWTKWIERALTFLVVSCPCALVISVPLSFFGGIGGAARRGILLKGASELEALSFIDTFVFDKTGTLTSGSFSVSEIKAELLSESELLSIAAALESHSNHPIAEAIISACPAPIEKERIGKLTELSGLGICGEIDGTMYYAGSARLMQKSGAAATLAEEVSTTVYIARENEYLGCILLSDQLKPAAAATISALRHSGIKKTVMLTGDLRKTAESIGAEAGICEIYPELLPQQKVEQIEKLLHSGARVAFVGDGINDAPVLMRSDIGIAMGSLGSDAAIEAADIVLMDDKLEKLPLALSICRKTMRIVWQNILISLLVKGAILVLAAFGFANMWIAIFGDVGVMLLAILNALRAMRTPKQ